MPIFELQRVPEAEVMADSDEVQAYSSAAAQAYLDQIDDTFVAHAIRLVRRRERGRALDIGTGPGQMVLKLARRLTRWKFAAVDRSPAMIAEAAAQLGKASELAGRVDFQVADGNALPFADSTFDFVWCNSVLHHFAEPERLLAEISRVVKPRGGVLLRDLRRPGSLTHRWHVRWHGRHYSGKMLELYRDSVRAAYTLPELQLLLQSSPLRGGAHVFQLRSTHIGIERPLIRD